MTSKDPLQLKLFYNCRTNVISYTSRVYFCILWLIHDVVRNLPCSWCRIQKLYVCLHKAETPVESTGIFSLWYSNSMDHSNIKNIFLITCLTYLSLLDVTQLTLCDVLSINLRFIRKLVVKDFF